ncbi:hypothetical protein NEMBOFW57_008157 [Staphylotrichum longicolle]|uniref:Uncharacterized protein n=1 Tax=Staphylotrichum longicolle TaxID=669026 RepID=A0AAD4EV03_9PEZI|nr:hypothetical protein NEMBOFW57_008157 [Staphylotrichum longicolle]
MSGNSAQQTAHIVTERSVAGWDDDDDDGRSTTKPFKKRYEIAIPTRNLRWANLARYLELEFKELGVQIPKDQKTVTVLNEHFVVMLPVRFTAEQKQDIDLLRGSQAEIDEFLEALEADKKLSTVSEGNENYT